MGGRECLARIVVRVIRTPTRERPMIHGTRSLGMRTAAVIAGARPGYTIGWLMLGGGACCAVGAALSGSTARSALGDSESHGGVRV